VATLSPELERGFVLLQAAVAEGALGDLDTADRRLDDLVELSTPTLLTLARVAADFVCGRSLTVGAEWTASTDDAGQMVAIEDRSPAPRVWSRRLLAAWSAPDPDIVDALFAAVAGDRNRCRTHVRDLLALTVDQAEVLAQRAASPYVVLYQLTRSVRRVGHQLERP
jgi:hypothetical protein